MIKKIITKLNIEHVLVSLFFVSILFIGLSVYKDYGISWDEMLQRGFGILNLNYVYGKSNNLFSAPNKLYGPSYQFTLIILELLFIKTGSSLKEIYEFRHLVNFLVHFSSCFFYYLLLKRILKDWKLGLLGTLMLFLSPRIFAHSFYNSKDLIFLDIFVIASYFSVVFLDKSSKKNTIVLGIVTAFLITVRLAGLLLPFLVVLLFFHKNRVRKIKEIEPLIIYGLTTFSLVFLMWPILWENPINIVIDAFNTAIDFPNKLKVFYFGQSISSTDLPWHYILGWLLVTTPVIYIILFFYGIFGYIKKGIRNLDTNFVFILSWFFLPLILVIVLKSDIYDGWRHMFFIYPAIIAVSTYGVKEILSLKRKFFSGVALLVLLINITFVSVFMIRNHPYQNVYFNVIAGKRAAIPQKFSMDYWGLCYRELLEYINSSVTAGDVANLYVRNDPALYNAEVFFPDNDKFNIVDNMSEADYYLTNYRDEDVPLPDNFKRQYSIMVDGFNICSVYEVNLE